MITMVLRGEDHQAGDRFDAWRELVGGMPCPYQVRSEHAADYDFTLRTARLGTVTVAHTSIPSIHALRTPRMIRQAMKTTRTMKAGCLALLVAAPLMAAAPASALAAPAATPGRCASWGVPGRDAYHVRPIHTVFTPEGGHIILESGKRRSDRHNVVWGHYPSNRNAARGKYLWMDVSFNGGSSWIQCGPFKTTNGNENLDTRFHVTSRSPSWKMRACGSDIGNAQFACTPWY